jgi:hypothetical protein
MQQHTNYTNNSVALNAVTNDNAFYQFKRNPMFTTILEHVNYNQGIQYINYIKTLCKSYNIDFENLWWNKYIENDILGNPITHNYKEQLGNIRDLNTYDISPTTLRYICFGLQLFDVINSTGKTCVSIIEVGGGYGGQCKILSDICLQFNINIQKYTIIDLEHVSKLQNKYLHMLNVDNFVTISNTNCIGLLDNEYDLFISNYALGEFKTDVQDFYIDNVLSKCSKSFITWNTYPINPKLKNINIVEEVPQTGHVEFPNIIITNN